MIVSMTGFAAVAADLPGVSLAVELRSVNHRYLDLQLRLPDELRGLESALRERIAAELKRGKVECRIALNRTTPGAAALADRPGARRSSSRPRRREVQQHAPGAAPLSINEILRWPGVLAEPTVAPEELAARAHELVGQALRDLAAARAREGAKTKATLDACCAAIEAQVARVAPRIPAVHAAYLERLGARLREAGLDPDQDRLKQELALFATKIDVAEEVSRLATHVAEVRRVLGRRRQRRQAPRFPDAGTAPRGEHARLEIGGRRAVAGVARAQGADRADARAGAEHRMSRDARGASSRRGNRAAACGSGRQPVRDRGALRRRQDEPRPRAARAEPGIRLSVSYTTRPPRPGEIDGVHYHFVDEPEFHARKAAGEFLEHAHVHGNWYATSATWLASEVAAGHDVLLEIDWQGASRCAAWSPSALTDLHPAAVARDAAGAPRQARAGQRRR